MDMPAPTIWARMHRATRNIYAEIYIRPRTEIETNKIPIFAEEVVIGQSPAVHLHPAPPAYSPGHHSNNCIGKEYAEIEQRIQIE